MNRIIIGALLTAAVLAPAADARHRRATTVVYHSQPAFTPVTTFAPPVVTPVSSPTPMAAPAAVPMSAGGLAQQKAETQARSGRCFHPGGSFGGGTHEGCGFSTVSADDAVRHCCYWGQRTPIDIGVARGANGWYATVIYR